MTNSRLHACCLAAVFLAACSPIRVPPDPRTPPAVVGTSLSRADAISDLDVLMRTFEAVHPNIYAERSREVTAAERQRLVDTLPDSLTRTEWWVRLSPFVAGFGDGHTNLQYPHNELARDADAKLFPAVLALDPEQHLVVRLSFDRTGGLNRGDRVLEINGRDADSLVRSWMAEFSGESEVYRAVAVADAFRDLLMIHSIGAPFQVKMSGPDGVERSAELAGITRQGIRETLRPKSPAPSAPKGLPYRTLEPEVGYVNLRGFGDLAQFKKDVAAMFRQVAADHDRKLIVDLRENGGGDSRLADELLRYITTTPYRMDSRKEWKMSAEYRAYLRLFLREPLRSLHAERLSGQGRQLFNGPNGSTVTMEEKMTRPVRAEPFFAGKVYMLIGPRTFSSAADLADAVKTYHLATLIGEETGGRVNTFGEVYPFVLPHSGFVVSVSSARFVRASGDTSDHRGVMPDNVVAPSREDLLASRDVVLVRARAE